MSADKSRALEIAEGHAQAAAARKRELWTRIQAEAPEFAEDMRLLRDFDYQVLHVELGDDVVWHVDEPPCKSMPARKWADFGRPMR